MLTLVSAPLSPFARMKRIDLLEKGILFELQTDIPWHNDTQAPKYNPLEKLPILLFDDGREPVYDSAHIQDYIVQQYANKGPSLIPSNIDGDLKARQILILSEGLLDAYVLAFWESRREVQNEAWTARQNRKIDRGLRAFEELVKEKSADSDYLLGNEMTIADIAVFCAIAQIDFSQTRPS